MKLMIEMNEWWNEFRKKCNVCGGFRCSDINTSGHLPYCFWTILVLIVETLATILKNVDLSQFCKANWALTIKINII